MHKHDFNKPDHLRDLRALKEAKRLETRQTDMVTIRLNPRTVVRLPRDKADAYLAKRGYGDFSPYEPFPTSIPNS